MVPPPTHREADVLAAALQLFARYGYKKTAMDEVAAAVGLSRQGLYLYFPTKEALFRAVIDHLLAQTLRAAEDALGQPGPLRARLLACYDATHGSFIEDLRGTPHLGELVTAAGELVPGALDLHHAALLSALQHSLETAGIRHPADFAFVFDLAATGLKYRAASRASFLADLDRVAAHLLGQEYP